MKDLRNGGFTLIELLIVVGIIAILAAIALPNFLEAQIRAKVSRARSDIRTLATALETYHIDNNRYCSQENDDQTPPLLSTPIAYVSTLPSDPFRSDLQGIDRVRWFSYNNVRERVDANTPSWPATDLKRYGDWRIYSWGPRREAMPYIPYDPTNGTVSPGNVLRTQASADGRIMYTYWDPSNPNL